MRRTSRGGWLSRLAAKRKKKWVWHPEFKPQNRKPGKSAPVTPCECQAEHGGPMFRILRRTRPSSHFTSGGVRECYAPVRPCSASRRSLIHVLVIGGQSHPISRRRKTQAQGAWQRPKSHRARGVVSRKRYGGVRAIRGSPSDVGPPAIVRCGDTPILQLPDGRRERHKRKPRRGGMSVSQPRRLHQKRATRSATGPRSPWSRTSSHLFRARIRHKRHKTPVRVSQLKKRGGWASCSQCICLGLSGLDGGGGT